MSRDDRNRHRGDRERVAVWVAAPAWNRRNQEERDGEGDQAEGDHARPAVELPAAAEGEREAEHQEEVADDATRERAAHDLGQSVVDGEESDDQLGRVAEGRVEEPADPRAGVVGRVLGRLADQPGERDKREGGEHEELDVAEACMVEHHDERPETEEGEEDFANHGRGTLTFAFR